ARPVKRPCSVYQRTARPRSGPSLAFATARGSAEDSHEPHGFRQDRALSGARPRGCIKQRRWPPSTRGWTTASSRRSTASTDYHGEIGVCSARAARGVEVRTPAGRDLVPHLEALGEAKLLQL